MSADDNGWIPAAEAESDGTQCELRFRNRFGPIGPYFLHDDGFWYLIEPPEQIRSKPTHFRPI